MWAPPPRRRRRRWPIVLSVMLVVAVLATGVVWTNVLGVGDRIDGLIRRVELAINPPADRPTVPTVQVTPPPTDEPAEPEPTLAAGDSREPGATARPTPSPRPRREAVRFKLAAAGNPETTFASQTDNTMCAPAGLQMVLAMHGLAETTDRFQKRLHGRLEEWETRSDAKAGGWGPAAMVEALAAYGASGYELRAYGNRNHALRDTAAAIKRTGAPAILIAWRGAHTWVMTGYRADADPTVFDDARITAINVFDPWYPRVSTIWGPSDPPGTLQDEDEIKRNFLQWERPEGNYAERDGKYLVVVPTIPLDEQQAVAPAA